MNRRTLFTVFPAVIVLVITSLACQVAGLNITKKEPTTSVNQVTMEVAPIQSTAAPIDTPVPPSPTTDPPTATIEPTIEATFTAEPPTATATIAHQVTPSNNPPLGARVYDVISKDTSVEKRAPYGDSYQINRLERPFSQDMTYIPELDIVTYRFSQDSTWTYVSIQLVGSDPNNPLGINYGVELDINADGFGEYVILAKPPYIPSWSTGNVQIYTDKNHNTSGKSAEKSDAPVETDGYETLVFDGAAGVGDDVDLAWVRVNAGIEATVQFAFKKTFPNKWYMLGVFADTGLKDVGKLDYVDRFTEAEAGSPIRGTKNYPLKELFSVDNACREALGFTPTGYEPQLCPRDEPTHQPDKPGITPSPVVCQRPSYCIGTWYRWHQDTCSCETILY